jgi:hypothetical protein
MIGFIGTSLRLKSITTAHNQWLSKTRSIPYWTTSAFPSAVADLVPIYESVTYTGSVVRWLALHGWTLNSLTTELLLICSFLYSSLYRLSVTVENVCCLSVVSCHRNVLPEPLASNGLQLWLQYSDFQASCHSTILTQLYGKLYDLGKKYLLEIHFSAEFFENRFSLI